MLVLSRKLDEEIVVEGIVVIRVVDIDRGKIRLGITAKPDVPIFRRELVEELGGIEAILSSWEPPVNHGGMLVLSRRLGQQVQFGRRLECCVTVVDIDRGKIRLGLEVPREVPIYRPGENGPGGSQTTVA